MSWTSPLTVARITLPLREPVVFSMNFSRCVDRRLHRLGRLQHLGDDQLVGVEEPADLAHPVHQRAVDDVERRDAAGPHGLEVVDETFLRAVEDVARQALERRARARAFGTFGAAPLALK